MREKRIMYFIIPAVMALFCIVVIIYLAQQPPLETHERNDFYVRDARTGQCLHVHLSVPSHATVVQDGQCKG